MKTGEVRAGFLEEMLELSPECPASSDKLKG